ncbi:MAG: AmmeMemoRadiSam system radical SAM enzyme [Deltaproteobacteria bacterium]|nr:MAG: AmmeMemoRadiSam system radical SAM enzyme [Deltaproteobacteria bacterium]
MEMTGLSRREFLARCFKGLCYLSLAPLPLLSRDAFPQGKRRLDGEWGLVGTKLSPYFQPLGGGEVRCLLCPRQCEISSGGRGHCEVRENRGGKLHSLVYGNPCAVHIDPIEKKPFFHVLPATPSFSIATTGCNFDCKFCQNWEISQEVPEKTLNFKLPPAEVVQIANEYKCPTIASTYVEPTIFFEYMYDVSVLAKGRGILSVCHSNGYINPKPLNDLCQYLGAACIDLKGFTEDFYQELTEGDLHPVLQTLKTLRRKRIHLELVNLVIPTKNDDMQVVRQMCLWIKRELGPDVPIHFSRFYPMYKLRNLPPTPVESLEKAREVALTVGLEYVYIGNVAGHEGENTYCPHCKKVLIARRGYFILTNNVIKGKCKFCGKDIPGIWQGTS